MLQVRRTSLTTQRLVVQVARAFRRNGYRVYGLVRGEDKAAALRREEIIPVIGCVVRVRRGWAMGHAHYRDAFSVKGLEQPRDVRPLREGSGHHRRQRVRCLGDGDGFIQQEAPGGCRSGTAHLGVE